MAQSAWDELVITSDNSEVCNYCIWDIRSGSNLETFDCGNTSFNCLAIMNNDFVVSGSKTNNLLKIWPRMQNSEANGLDMTCPDRITALDVSHSGTYFIAAIKYKLYLWQVVSGNLMCILSVHRNHVNKVKFTKDERFFISCDKNGYLMAWKVFDIVNERHYNKKNPIYKWRDNSEEIIDFALTCFGLENKIVSVSKSLCKVYSLETGKCLRTFDKPNSPFTSVTIDAMGIFIFIGNKVGDVLQIEFDFTPKQELHRKVEDEVLKILPLHKLAVTCLGTSINGRFLISGSADKTAIIWDIFSSCVVRVLPHIGTISNAFFIPSAYLNTSRNPLKVIKPFKFELSHFDVESWQTKLKDIDQLNMELDEHVFGSFPLNEKAGNALKSTQKNLLTEKDVRQSEFTNEFLYFYSYLANSKN